MLSKPMVLKNLVKKEVLHLRNHQQKLNLKELVSISSHTLSPIQVTSYLEYVLIGYLAFGPWVELPVITPKHVLMARKIKHIFTGNLEANIITNPFFFGYEKHYVINMVFER